MILVHYLLLNAGDCILSVIGRFSELVNTFSHFFITVKTNAYACSETSCNRLKKKRLKLTHIAANDYANLHRTTLQTGPWVQPPVA